MTKLKVSMLCFIYFTYNFIIFDTILALIEIGPSTWEDIKFKM
jgi:hypothetical protein